jgi:hypothetical protein
MLARMCYGRGLASIGGDMKTVAMPRAIPLAALLAVMASVEGCRAIEGIFKAGVWVGVVIAIVVIGIVIAVVRGFGAG